MLSQNMAINLTIYNRSLNAAQNVLPWLKNIKLSQQLNLNKMAAKSIGTDVAHRLWKYSIHG